jgi:hypothetical protein
MHDKKKDCSGPTSLLIPHFRRIKQTQPIESNNGMADTIANVAASEIAQQAPMLNAASFEQTQCTYVVQVQ